MIDEKVTPSFWLSEFLESDTATRMGLDNSPDAESLRNLRLLTIPGMQSVRDCLGQPIFISSGYRSPAVNKAVGGAASSQHQTGQAADFKCPNFGSPLTVARWIVAHQGVKWDQLIMEGQWCHISFSDHPRGQVLTAHFGPGGVTYTSGLT
jgi:hypothetical protein